LPVEDGSHDEYYVWNRAQVLFELVVSQGKASETISLFQFSRLARVPGFGKA